MRLTTNVTKSGTSYYIIRSIKRNGKRSSEVVEKLGTDKEICERYNCTDAALWAKNHLDELNQAEASKITKVLIPFDTSTLVTSNERRCFNVGYLFLQQIYYDLGLQYISKKISAKYDFQYNLDSILSRLVYERILFPNSKKSTFDSSKKLLEQPDFDLHHIYRALSVLSKESDFIQSELYKNSSKIIKRQTGVLFYDCTNYFFEIESEDGIKKYGPSKEHRPNPIVQMGLFMDKSGIPLAFCINSGNTNEQVTLKPLEKKIMSDFELSEFVVCTDAGLSSADNRKFNNFGGRRYITTQSIKTLKKELQDWCLNPKGWHLKGSKNTYDISQLDENDSSIVNNIYYKEKYIEDYDKDRDISFNQTLVVTFSVKYKKYQRKIRNNQIERANKYLEKPGEFNRKRQNDYKRFIKSTSVTKEGEIADGNVFTLDEEVIKKEEKYDGFYASCTNLDDDGAEIAAINHARWEIEESFRIMKTEFEARPVYLQRDDRIKAHFLTCFIALLVYRILEKKMDEKYSCETLIKTMREMDVLKLKDEGYTPTYRRTEVTDALHEMAGFRTDYELTKTRTMKGICRRSKE